MTTHAGKPEGQLTQAIAYAAADRYWKAKGDGSRMMSLRAFACVELAGGGAVKLDHLGPHTGAELLSALREDGFGQSSVASYYAAYRRMLALAGLSTVTWPSAGPIPRKLREPISEEDLDALRGWLLAQDYPETAYLLSIIQGTGMRVRVEALSWTAWAVDGFVVTVTGKGGHMRRVPISAVTRHFLTQSETVASMRRLDYSTHLKRWNAGVEALGITSKRPTPHAVRHLYATLAWRRCKDLRVVQELLGHADPATTAGYIGVDMDELAKGAGV